ncbi:MAG: hypothetical protein E7678_00600 [Ruminococcaceae bacterium]|nr:hypothetical protein [Oscillospiraceae bacterium]
MKKQIRKAMICTIAMMLMGIVSLTGVTYAWFSQSDTARVKGMNLSIIAKEGGVLMSAVPNPSEWGYGLDLQMNETDYNPASTVPANLQEDGTLKFYNGVIDELVPSSIYTEAIGQNKYYIQKDIYFWNDSLDQDITVVLDKEDTLLGNATNGVEMAMRMAIVNHGKYDKGIDTKENAPNAEKHIEDVFTKDPNNVKIYEFAPNTHLDGTTKVKDTYGVKAASGKDNYFDTKDVGSGVVTEDTKWPNYLEKTTTVHKDSGTDISFVVEKDTYHKITVYIWLEGQDADCKNAISGSSMNIQLAFKKAD